MFWKTRELTAGIVLVGVALLGCPAHAQTTSTTSTSTTSTTSTTLLRHPYSDATKTCVRAANQALKACTDTAANCQTQYQTDFSKCFAAGTGAKCAKSCITKDGSCVKAAPATRATCKKACRVTRRRDVNACHTISDGDNIWAGGDAACLTTAAGNFDLCLAVCRQALVDCQTTFEFCIANCPNL